MDLNLPDTHALRRLHGAIATGAVYLLNEDAQPVTFEEVLDVHCWAHLRDTKDGQVYLQELWRGSRELLSARYQGFLGLAEGW